MSRRDFGHWLFITTICYKDITGVVDIYLDFVLIERIDFPGLESQFCLLCARLRRVDSEFGTACRRTV